MKFAMLQLVALCLLMSLCCVRVEASTANTLRIARLETGDAFTNLEGGDEEFCEAAEAECVPSTNLGPLNNSSLEIGDCSETVELDSSSECPACKCKNRGRFDTTELSCEPELLIGTGNLNCPEEVGFDFIPRCKRQFFPGKQHILVDKIFPCYGRLTEWKFRRPCGALNGSWVLLQVWKPVGSGFFSRSHSNNITFDRLTAINSSSSGPAQYTVSLQEHEQAVVQPGYVIGLYSTLGTTGFPFLYTPIDPPTVDSSRNLVFPFPTTNTPPEYLLEHDAIMVPAVIANLVAVVGPLDGVVECNPLSDTTSIPTSDSDTADASGISLSILAVIISCAAVAFIAVLVGCFGIIAVLIYCGFKKRSNANINRNSVAESRYEYAGGVVVAPPLPPPNYKQACRTQDRPNTIYETIPEPGDEEHHVYATLEGPIASDDEDVYSDCGSPAVCDSNCDTEDEEERTGADTCDKRILDSEVPTSKYEKETSCILEIDSGGAPSILQNQRKTEENEYTDMR